MVTLSTPPAGNAPVPVYEARTLYQVPIDLVREDPDQPRKSFDAQGLEEMVASITKHGIIQPVIFRRGPNGTAIIVAGERRVSAAQQIGLTEIPGIFIVGNTAEIALVENLQRQDLTTIEEAEALQRLKDEQKYTDEQLSGVIGKARSTITEILTLNKLPLEIRDECRGDRQISRTTLLEISRKKQDRSMLTAYAGYKAKQQKGKTARTKTDPNASQPAFDLFEKAATKINAIDASAWTEEEKANLKISLTNLKSTIETFLAPPAKKAGK